VRLVPLIRPVRELFGMLHRPGRKPVSVEAMDAAIAEGREVTTVAMPPGELTPARRGSR